MTNPTAARINIGTAISGRMLNNIFVREPASRKGAGVFLVMAGFYVSLYFSAMLAQFRTDQ